MENLYMDSDFWNIEKEFYIKLNDEKKIVWLSRFGYYLCISIRGEMYDYRQENNFNENKVDNFNDILLQIFGKIGSKIRNDDNFSDIDFFDMLKEKCIRTNYDISYFIKDIRSRLDLMDK